MKLSDGAIVELLGLAAVPLSHQTLESALDAICLIAARALPQADGASLTSFETGGPKAAAASSDWARDLDEMQYDEREGPCIDAARTGALFRVRDIASETRWPSYMPRASERGAASMMSIPMTVEAKTIGALNIYSREADAFTAEDFAIAEVIAGHATLASQAAAALQRHRDLADQLQTALSSRPTIEQAKGIIMATKGCGPDEAFAVLREQSQHQNIPLRQIAQELVDRQRRS